MFDTMTLTKTAGALCGALLVFLLGNWAAGAIFSMGGGHGGEHVQGYLIETVTADAEEVAVEEGPSLAERMAAADPANGEKLFRNCAACHAVVKGENKVGPYLYGVVGRKVDTAEGYAYSGALEKVVDVWTPVELFAFLENPKGYAPGTTMGFAGLRKPEDRADLISYLDQTDGTTFEMPADAAAVAAPAAEVAATAEQPAAAEAPAVAAEAPAAAAEAPAATEPAVAATEAPAAAETVADQLVVAAEPAPATTGASDFAGLVAAADIAAGEKIFRRCAACHKVEDGKNAAGPHLFGVVGREIASVEGFKYSDALKALSGSWTPEMLNAWITNPRDVAPGNRMGFPGIKDETERANVIGYLQSVGN